MLNHDRAWQHDDEHSPPRCLPSTPKLYTLRGARAVGVISHLFSKDRRRCVPECCVTRLARGTKMRVKGARTRVERTQYSSKYAFITSTGQPQTPNHI
jgi:hypothetical protein